MYALFVSLPPARKRLVLLIIVYIGFISLGLPDTILGVAWAPMRAELKQPVYYAGFIVTLLTLCSAVSSFFSGAILRRIGTGRLLMICGFVTGCSLFGYALSPAYWTLLVFAVPLGFGQGAVDTGMNYYVAKHYTSRDMNWLHCCWGVGASLGPLLATTVLTLGGSWRFSYITVGGIQLTLAILFALTLTLWQDTPSEKNQTVETVRGAVRYSTRFFACPAMFFLYCGIEASTGLWAYQFLTTSRGVPAGIAGFAVAGYWGMLTAGRFVVGFIANRLGNRKQIQYSMWFGLTGGLVMLIPGSPVLTLAAVGMVGFAFAPFYPAMMHAAPERFDDVTAATVIGYQGGAAMLGSALIPVSFGILAAKTGFLLLPYAVIAFTAALILLQRYVDGGRNTFKQGERQ